MAQSPFETMTPESLKNEMLARVKEKGVDIDAREGSYANVLLSEAAYVMWKYGQTLNGFMSIIFPDASSGEYLDLHAAQIGMSRQSGAKASVTVTFTGTDGTEIPAGTIVCTPSALRFLTAENITIADGTASVLCTAEEIGADYNVPEATVTQMAVNVPGVSGVTNAAAGTGGAAVEWKRHGKGRYWRRGSRCGRRCDRRGLRSTHQRREAHWRDGHGRIGRGDGRSDHRSDHDD